MYDADSANTQKLQMRKIIRMDIFVNFIEEVFGLVEVIVHGEKGEPMINRETYCNECGERIGYISINAHLKTKYIKTIRDGNAYVELLCDDCREGRLDLDEGEADD